MAGRKPLFQGGAIKKNLLIPKELYKKCIENGGGLTPTESLRNCLEVGADRLKHLEKKGKF